MMCVDPGSLSLITTLLGTGLSAVGTLASANATAQAATYKAENDRMLAEDALKRGHEEEDAQRRKTAALMGRQRAVMAAGNVDLGSGSPLAILGDTAALGELDAQTIKGNAKREATFYENSAKASDMEAKSAKTAGMFGAFSTILGGAGTLADKWYKPGAKVSNDPWSGMRFA